MRSVCSDQDRLHKFKVMSLQTGSDELAQHMLIDLSVVVSAKDSVVMFPGW